MGKHKEKDIDYKPVTAVSNALALLRVISQYGEKVGLATLARETGVSATTSSNILRTMAQEKIIAFDPALKTYQMELGVLDLSLPVLGLNQADIIRPELERLAEEHRLLTCLWRFDGTRRVRLVESAAAEGMVRVEMPRGLRLPAFAGAVGRCNAAYSPLSEADLRAEFDKITWQNPPSFEEYLADLEDVRSTGFAVDFRQLYSGLETVAALVVDSSGQLRFGVSAIDILGSKTRKDWLEIAVSLRDRADRISEVLFGVPKASIRNRRKLSKISR